VKAAVIHKYGGPEEFRIEEIPEPVIRPDEVLIRVMYASINPVDWKQRNGNHKLFLKAKFPLIVGYDVAGTIAETGADTKRFQKGDRVYARCDRRFGRAFAEYAATSEGTVGYIPEDLDFKHAAAVPLAAITALQGLRDKGGIKRGDKLLIIGAAGGVGHFAVQIGKAYGAEVTAVCSSRHNNMMQELQPDHLIDYTTTDILELTEKFDIIFDAAAIHSYLSCRHLLSSNGSYINTKPRPKMLIHKLVSVFSPGRSKTFLMKSKASDLDIISGMIKDGKIKIFIDSVYPLERISDAHRKAEEYHTNGKIIIKI